MAQLLRSSSPSASGKDHCCASLTGLFLYRVTSSNAAVDWLLAYSGSDQRHPSPFGYLRAVKYDLVSGVNLSHRGIDLELHVRPMILDTVAM